MATTAHEPRAGRRGRQAGLLAGAAALGGQVLLSPALAQPALPGEPPGLGQRPFDIPGRVDPAAGLDVPGFWGTSTNPFFGIGLGSRPADMPGPLWSLLPSLEVQAGATDNVRNSASNRQADVYTRIRPQLTLAADTAELVGALTWAPSFAFYANESDQNRVTQAFSGQAQATLIENLLFVDISGSGDARSAFGSLGGFDATADDRRSQVQTTNYQISPYVVQRFGGLATARAGYVFRQSIESGRDAFLPGEAQPFFTSQDYVSHGGYATLRSGEDWGRVAFQLQTSVTRFEGSGIYDGARRDFHAAQLRYALTRELAVLVDGGWQDERYSGVRPLTIQDPVWGVGLRYAPTEDGFVVLRYGQRDGFESFSLDGSLTLGARTRVFARYSEQISSSSLLAGDLLNSLRVDALGNVVDAATGVPAALAAPSSLLSSQSNLFRTKRATVAVSQAWTRDTLTLNLSREERDPAAVAAGTTAFSEEVTSVGLSWGRDLAPGTSLSTSGSLGRTESEARGTGTRYGFQVALSQSLTPTLFGTLQYWFRSSEAGTGVGDTTQNTILVSLRQFF